MDVDMLEATDVMTHLNTEVARLANELRNQAAEYELHLRAEREYSRRLSMACSLYRSAAMMGWAVLDTEDDQTNVHGIHATVRAADELVMPTAKEE